MNFVKQVMAAGMSAIMLSAPVTAASQHIDNKQIGANLLFKAGLASLSQQGKQLSIEQIPATLGGFNSSNFSIYLPKDVSKIPYCGYDEQNHIIVPKYVTQGHMLFEAISEVLNHLQGNTSDKIFEDWYGSSADVFKLLWKNPYGRPESKLTAMTGLSYKNGVLGIDELNTMAYDFENAIKNGSANAFIPRVFSVTYDEFCEIQQKHSKVNLLQDIGKLLTYKKID